METNENYPATKTVWTDTKTTYVSGDSRTVVVTSVRQIAGPKNRFTGKRGPATGEYHIYVVTCDADGTRDECCKPYPYTLDEFNERFTAA